jgi:hypothetical protein
MGTGVQIAHVRTKLVTQPPVKGASPYCGGGNGICWSGAFGFAGGGGAG